MLRILATIGLGGLAVATFAIVDSALDEAQSIAEQDRTLLVDPLSSSMAPDPGDLTITCDALAGDGAVISGPVYLGSPFDDRTTLYGLMSDDDFDALAESSGNSNFPGQAGAPTLAQVRRGLRADLGSLCEQERATQQTDVAETLGRGALELGVVAALTAMLGPMLVGKRLWKRRPGTDEPSAAATGAAA